MWGLITGLPALISGLFGTVNGITNAIANEKIAGLTAQTDQERIRSAERVKTLEYQRDQKIAEIGHPFEPDKLMQYFVATYFGKLLIWDKVLGLGVTDGLGGWVDVTANLVVTYMFGKSFIDRIKR